MKVNIIYQGDGRSEIADIRPDSRFKDLRERFKDTEGRRAEAVEILSRN